MSTRVLEFKNNIQSVDELIETLQNWTRGVRDTTYVQTRSGDYLRAELEEEKLTDGSCVYNITISDSPIGGKRK